MHGAEQLPGFDLYFAGLACFKQRAIMGSPDDQELVGRKRGDTRLITLPLYAIFYRFLPRAVSWGYPSHPNDPRVLLTRSSRVFFLPSWPNLLGAFDYQRGEL